MLAIRMQRTGRSGHAQFRVVVQDAHRTPTSGKLVAQIGHYNPHSKQAVIDKEKVEFYLKNGAQPSDRVVKLLLQEGVALPKWVKQPGQKARTVRNPEKLRANRPAEPEAEPEAAVTETTETEVSVEASADAENAQAETKEEPAAEADAPEQKTEA